MIELSPQQALIAKLANCAPNHAIGRTALMKLCFLLQEVRGVPLQYRFTLYAYGPYDKAVLDDLGQTESLGAVTEECEIYGSGYGYKIRSNVDEARLNVEAKNFLARYKGDIDWVVKEFGGKSASELELLATVVYADHESQEDGNSQTQSSLAKIVAGIKPKFPLSQIEHEIEWLRQRLTLQSLAEAQA